MSFKVHSVILRDFLSAASSPTPPHSVPAVLHIHRDGDRTRTQITADPKEQQSQSHQGTRSATLPSPSCLTSHHMLLSAPGSTNLFNPGSQQSWQGSRNARILLPRDNFSTNLHFCYCLSLPDGHPGSPAHSFCGAALPLFYPASSLTSLFCSHSTHFPNLCLVSFFFFFNCSQYVTLY